MADDVPDRRNRRSKALERVTDGIVSLDEEFTYTYLNPQAEAILGRTSDDLLGKTVWEAFPETAGTVAETELEEAMATQQQRSFERHNSALDRWFGVRVYPDESGLTIYFSDITDRKRMERELERTNRQLSALIENTSEAIYSKDREGHYELMNEAAAELFGLDPQEVVGKHDAELFDDASAADIRQVDERIVERNEPDTREAVRYIDGDKHVFLDNKYPYCDEDGAVVGIMGISRDITERKRREQELAALSEEYETIFDNADDAVFLVDVEDAESDPVFRFSRLNHSHEATTGFRSEELRGQTPREVFGEDVGAEIAANYRRCVEAREPIAYEEVLPLPSSRFTWQTKLAPVIVDGDVTRIVGIARDITDRVEREEELRRKTDRLDGVASVISHDLRSPLSVAQARTSLLREQCADEHVDDLDSIAESLDRMQAIIEDTLLLARQGQSVGDTAAIPVGDLVHRCWSVVETSGATLDVADAFTIQGDSDRVRHVFENLFRNAIEHAGEDVAVRVGRAGEDCFYVEDDGPGIPPAERETVFDSGQTSTTEGTGFGLAIVARIAEAHGWDVTVTDGPKGGARFEFHDVGIRDG